MGNCDADADGPILGMCTADPSVILLATTLAPFLVRIIPASLPPELGCDLACPTYDSYFVSYSSRWEWNISRLPSVAHHCPQVESFKSDSTMVRQGSHYSGDGDGGRRKP
jgi:hypothetical protein